MIYAVFWFLIAGIIAINLGTLSGLPPELRKAVPDRLAAERDGQPNYVGVLLLAMALLTLQHLLTGM